MIDRRRGLRDLALAGLMGLTLTASLVPTVAVAVTGTASDLPEWAQDDGDHAEGPLGVQASLPSKYDLRNDGFVTPVKQQGPFMSCWSFGGIAAAEISILSSSGVTFQDTVQRGTPLDLSERHLAYFALHPITADIDPAQAGEGFHLKSEETNAALQNGGNGMFITTLFSQGVGPVAEAQFPYRGKDAITSLQEFEADPEGAVTRQLNLEAKAKNMTYEQYIEYLIENSSLKTEEAIRQAYRTALSNNAKNDMTYSATDDWDIPEKNDEGASNRTISGGFVLKDGNVLPDYWVPDAAHAGSPNTDAIRCVKQELLNGRGVFFTYRADDTGAYTMSTPGTSDMYNQCITSPLSPNHGVCVVGWDDNYAAENFHEGARPAGNGAWIVKNSWGSEIDCEPDDLGNVVSHRAYGIPDEEGGHTGYFYLSYYDRTIVGQETMQFSSNLLGEGRFFTAQHDYLPACGGFYDTEKSEDLVSSANVFEIGEPADICSVSTRTSDENMRTTLAIYILDEGAESPTDGKLVGRTSRNFEYAGFHRVDLDNPIPVKAGQRVSVVSTASFVNPETGVRIYGASASKAYKERPNGTFTAVVNEGESYVFQNGAWQDWSDYLAKADTGEFVVDNFSIKLYATPGDPEPVEEGQEVWRLYNPYTGEHFYTTSSGERDHLASVGWNDEGLGWVAPQGSDEAVCRLYNP